MRATTLCTAVAVLLFCTFATSESLSVKYSRVQVTVENHSGSASYDGADSIYIFGNYYQRGVIIKYSLSKDTFQEEVTHPLRVTHGSTHSDSHGNVFYFGAGVPDWDKVLKYSPATKLTTVVGQLPYKIYNLLTIKLDNDTVLILGGYCNSDYHQDCWNNQRRDILSYDLRSNSYTILDTKLPINLGYGGAIKFGQEKVYLFPAQPGYKSEDDKGSVWEWNLVTMAFEMMPDMGLPNFDYNPTIVTDGTWIYAVARLKLTPEYERRNEFIKIDPTNKTVEFVGVDNWPIYEQPPPCVFIHKLKSICCIGGHKPTEGEYTYISDLRRENDIFFISLGENHTSIFVYAMIILCIILGILVILVIGWRIRKNRKKKNDQSNPAVVFVANQNNGITN